jgi:formate-dependent nitrite reductase membrane component NrfD
MKVLSVPVALAAKLGQPYAGREAVPPLQFHSIVMHYNLKLLRWLSKSNLLLKIYILCYFLFRTFWKYIWTVELLAGVCCEAGSKHHAGSC